MYPMNNPNAIAKTMKMGIRSPSVTARVVEAVNIFVVQLNLALDRTLS